MKRIVVGAVIALSAWLLLTPPASAHPLGNFTINTAAAVRVAPHRVSIDHVIDMAEIPTYQAQGDIRRAGRRAWAQHTCDTVARDVEVDAGDERIALHVVSTSLSFPPGQADLPTLRLVCALASGTVDSSANLRIADHVFEHKVGWREITAVGDGSTITSSDVPAVSPSAELTAYPSGGPRVVRSASIRSVGGGSAATITPPSDAVTRLLPRGIDRAGRSFTGLVSSRSVTVPFVLLSLLAAAALGALHAVAPGHGKTVMGAYIVGRRGTVREGLLIGATVAVTHTAGVLVLGIGLWVSEAVAPERLIPMLGVVSGVLLVGIGAGLLRRALTARGVSIAGHHAHHDHHHGHEHRDQHGHDHDDLHEHHDHDHVEAPPRRSALVLLGLAGGMVPSPSALVVLLGALAIGRAWLGVALVVAYGVGMACCLVGAGLLLARLGSVLERRMRGAGDRRAWVVRTLPVAAASVVVVVGMSVVARAAAQL
ncbi:MAG: nickel/cobalt transporter (NicO) family protein [Actinomycetota bacterium]|jgi:ABC-type nickel/cobalt efflux system permease component RcnA